MSIEFDLISLINIIIFLHYKMKFRLSRSKIIDLTSLKLLIKILLFICQIIALLRYTSIQNLINKQLIAD